jgi:hypothetical protein
MKFSKYYLAGSHFNSLSKLMLIISCFFVAGVSFAQKNLQPATLINANRDTLHGFIDYRNWEKNPDKIDFYRSVDSPAASYTPQSIKSFEVSGEKYTSAAITYDDSPYRTEDLKEEVIYNYVIDTVFLLTLMQGDKSLYYFRDVKGKENYFILNKSGFELLLYKRYFKRAENGGITVAQNKKFTGQLQNYLQECSSIQKKFPELRYNRTDLVKLFQAYYECTNKNENSQNKAFTKQNQFGILAGVSFTKLTYYNGMDYFSEADYPVSTNFSGGVFYDIVFPRNFGRMSISNQFLYYAYKTESFYNESVTTSIGLNYIMMNNLARYKFPLNKADFFIEAGTAVGFGFNETNYQKFEETSSQRASEQKAFRELSKLYLGVNTGLGFTFGKMLLECRYMFGFKKTDFLPEGTSVGSRINAGFVMVGYRF